MIRQRFTRRRLLEGTAGLAIVGLAGCTGSPAGAEQQAGETSTEGEHSGDDHPGHSDEEHSHEGVSEPKEAREVLVNTARGEDTTEYHFKPHITWVIVGGTVTWKLQSGNHTATAYHPGNDEPRLVPEGTDPWDSGLLTEKGETYQHTFDTEGVYHYFCKPHEQFGMLGTVIVGQPDLEDQVALGKIPDDKPEEVRGKLKELNEMVHSTMEGGHHEGESEDGHHEEETETSHHEGEDGHHDEETTTETNR